MKKVILITGGSSGIGKAIGEFLLEKGFVVYGTSRNASAITKKTQYSYKSEIFFNY